MRRVSVTEYNLKNTSKLLKRNWNVEKINIGKNDRVRVRKRAIRNQKNFETNIIDDRVYDVSRHENRRRNHIPEP